jgi:hypothetical protein
MNACLLYLGISQLINLAVCLTKGPKPLPNRAVHIVQSRAYSFRLEYPLLSLRLSSSFLRLLPRLPLTSIPSFIFPSITSCRRQFQRKIWPIHLAIRLLIPCRIFLSSLILSNTCSFPTWSVHLIIRVSNLDMLSTPENYKFQYPFWRIKTYHFFWQVKHKESLVFSDREWENWSHRFQKWYCF